MEKSSFGNQKYFKWKCLNWIHLKKIVRKKSFFSKVVHFWRFPTTRKMNYFTKETFFSEKNFSNGFSLNIFIWRIFDYQNLIFPFRCSQVLGTFFLNQAHFKIGVICKAGQKKKVQFTKTQTALFSSIL